MTNFEVNKYEPKDFSLLVEWAHARKFVLPKEEHLPPTGRLVVSNGKGYCVGFLCKTDSKMAVICAMISNPAADKEDRQAAVNFLMRYFADLAKKEGFTMVAISSSIPSFKKRIAESGFHKAEENVTIFGASL